MSSQVMSAQQKLDTLCRLLAERAVAASSHATAARAELRAVLDASRSADSDDAHAAADFAKASARETYERANAAHHALDTLVTAASDAGVDAVLSAWVTTYQAARRPDAGEHGDGDRTRQEQDRGRSL